MTDQAQHETYRATSFSFPEHIHTDLNRASRESGLPKNRILMLLIKEHLKDAVSKYKLT